MDIPSCCHGYRAEKNVIVPLQINACANCLEYAVVKPLHILKILTWPSGSSQNEH